MNDSPLFRQSSLLHRVVVRLDTYSFSYLEQGTKTFGVSVAYREVSGIFEVGKSLYIVAGNRSIVLRHQPHRWEYRSFRDTLIGRCRAAQPLQ